MAQPDPRYDIAGALAALLPGINLQRNLIEAAAAQYAANGFTALTAPQALACLVTANDTPPPALATPADSANVPTTQPAYPTALPAPIPLDGEFAGLVEGYGEPEVLMNLPRFPDSNPSPKLGLNSGASSNPRVVGG